MKIKLNRKRNGGFWLLIICLIAIIILGIICWMLFDTARTCLPPHADGSPATTNIQQTVDIWTNYYSLKPAPRDNESSGSFFPVQYGINMQALPWVNPGSNYTQTTYGQTRYIQNDETNLETTVCQDGWTFHVYTSSDPASPPFVWHERLEPSTIVIQRTTNFVDWDNAFTNPICGVNTIETFMDTVPPPAYYRAILVP